MVILFIGIKKSGSSEQFGSPNSNGCPDSNGSSSDSNPRGSERNCLKLRGLPWEATTEEVMEFFGDISRHIQQHGVHMVLDARVSISNLYIRLRGQVVRSLFFLNSYLLFLYRHSYYNSMCRLSLCKNDSVLTFEFILVHDNRTVHQVTVMWK